MDSIRLQKFVIVYVARFRCCFRRLIFSPCVSDAGLVSAMSAVRRSCLRGCGRASPACRVCVMSLTKSLSCRHRYGARECFAVPCYCYLSILKSQVWPEGSLLRSLRRDSHEYRNPPSLGDSVTSGSTGTVGLPLAYQHQSDFTLKRSESFHPIDLTVLFFFPLCRNFTSLLAFLELFNIWLE